jgi:F-type H+-transporting ATPase subunit gamma
MPSLKEVRGRIQSINSTQQITKALKMVSAAKLRRSQDAILQMRPYSNRLSLILQNISASIDDSVDNPFATERTPNKVLLVVVTSDRGLAGAFNSRIIKATNNLIAEKYSQQAKAGNVHLLTIGKKGMDFFNRRGFTIHKDFVSTFTILSFGAARKAAEFAMDAFLKGDYDKVEIVYNEFKNVATQVLRIEQFLPIVPSQNATDKASKTDYIYEPSKEEIFKELVPKSLKVQFYKTLLESNASEHGARMMAMDKATENAKDLLKELKLIYNRTRQAAITKEILEIVGGAEALAAS